jgi:predicted GIY-YIG superfamily endonuclease
MPYYCYLITNGKNTYNGYTVDLYRRLRQHNGEIKGGAKSTRNKGLWKYILYITCNEWTCISDAMKYEYLMKYPTRKKPRPTCYQGIVGRINSIKEICNHNNQNLILYIDNDYYEDLLKLNLPENIICINNLIQL